MTSAMFFDIFIKKKGLIFKWILKNISSLPHYLSFDAVYFEAESYQLLQQPISPVVHEVWSPSVKKNNKIWIQIKF